MLNPNLNVILDQGISRYSLVTATAKRAREIALKNLEEQNHSTEKPVTEALDDIINGRYKIVENKDIID